MSYDGVDVGDVDEDADWLWSCAMCMRQIKINPLIRQLIAISLTECEYIHFTTVSCSALSSNLFRFNDSALALHASSLQWVIKTEESNERRRRWRCKRMTSDYGEYEMPELICGHFNFKIALSNEIANKLYYTTHWCCLGLARSTDWEGAHSEFVVLCAWVNSG